MNSTLTKILFSGGLSLALLGGAATTASAGSEERPQGQEEAQARTEARFENLTEAQRDCLVDAGLTRPTARPTGEQRQALRQAAADCGIDIPSGRPDGVGGPNANGRPTSSDGAQARKAARFGQLSEEQQSCLADAGLTRPTARPTAEQRQALTDAAADCGIAIPSGGGSSHARGPR